MVPRQHGAAGRRNQSALLLEAVNFLQARGERTRLRVETRLLRLPSADAGGQLFAPVLEGFQIRGGSQSLRRHARHAFLLARGLSQLRLEPRNFLAAGVFPGRDLVALAIEVGGIFREAGLLDLRHERARLDALPFLRHAGDETSAAGEGEIEPLFFGNRQQLHPAPVVVLLPHERAVAPRARYGDHNRHRYPDRPFHPVRGIAGDFNPIEADRIAVS